MQRNWVTRSDDSYAIETAGFRLRVSYDPDDSDWEWSVILPDGSHYGGAEDTQGAAQAEAAAGARHGAIMLANRLFARCHDMGALTTQEHDLLAKALSFLGEDISWGAYLGDDFMGSGPTPEQAIEDAVREYEDAIGYDEDRIASREELEEQLTVCLAEDE